ncbi:hypothetical protein NDU88_004824 [Pleurodeles waltl]|uniref:Uncharacterized protein n=1 Tax=Pleurodeles waltl TaxID=8319 RepID=A0AAV7QH71_PLEWA|nr:hypothetical protein NDU88_004824 [Pleurodeles waltl]
MPDAVTRLNGSNKKLCLQEQQSDCQSHADDLKNHSRWNSIRIQWVPQLQKALTSENMYETSTVISWERLTSYKGSALRRYNGGHARADPFCQGDDEPKAKPEDGEDVLAGQCPGFLRGGHWASRDSREPIHVFRTTRGGGGRRKGSPSQRAGTEAPGADGRGNLG